MMTIAVGCGPDLQSICEQAEDCHGGNEKDVEACVVQMETEQELVDDIGCSDEYDEYMECYEGSAECRDGGPGVPCQTEADCGGAACDGGQCAGTKSYGLDDDACEVERNDYQQCFDLD